MSVEQVREISADESLFLGDFFNYAGGTVMEGGAPRPYRRREAEWDDKRRRGTYACGGGGSVFSRRALEAMDLGRCMRDYHKKCMQSDWMIADCARKFNVTFAVRTLCFPQRAQHFCNSGLHIK